MASPAKSLKTSSLQPLFFCFLEECGWVQRCMLSPGTGTSWYQSLPSSRCVTASDLPDHLWCWGPSTFISSGCKIVEACTLQHNFLRPFPLSRSLVVLVPFLEKWHDHLQELWASASGPNGRRRKCNRTRRQIAAVSETDHRNQFKSQWD